VIVWLRTLAAAIAVAALVDPALHVRRRERLPVDVIGGGHSAAAGDIGVRLRRRLEPIAAVGTGKPPAAVILIAPVGPDVRIPDGVPVSVIEPVPAPSPNVQLAGIGAPPSAMPGEEVRVTADLEASGMAGKSSLVVLEQGGVAVARVEHRWTGSFERFRAELVYAPPAPGIGRLRVVARPVAGESSDRDNAADLTMAVTARTLRILVHEPRPSWAAAFVRRALESDPVFEVASTTSLSRGPAVRAGSPPRRLTASDLETFDAVVVGAPETLVGPEVAALDAFARVRGGGVVLLPDRKPSGAYLSLLPKTPFDEILLERPAALETGHGLQAAEIAAPADVGRSGVALATLEQGSARRPVVVSWPRGGGRILWSGALDAWRYRARNDDGFARFWSALVAAVAEGAPPRIGVRVDPAIAAPGESVAVRVAVRATEIVRDAGGARTPSVEARIIAADGSERVVRLWPTAEAGAFEGRIPAPAPGRYDVRASLSGKAAADAALVVADGIGRPGGDAGAMLQWVAASTGGVTIVPSELDRLASHLETLQRAETTVGIHPLRSPWWMAPFAFALSAAWALGRRRGLP
jgi:hypothetical protein